MNELWFGDAFAAFKQLPDDSIDSIVCDPPYGIEFMDAKWDTFSGAGSGFTPLSYAPDSKPLPTFGKGLDAARAFGEWSRSWATEALRVLKPGAHVLAFGGSRTYHRLGWGIEEAGFEIRDCLEWIYGQGYPKSHDVALALDRKAGVERPDRGTARVGTNKVLNPTHHTAEKGTPVTADAKKWEGWGTGLKPAHEPIVLARKPMQGRVAANVVEHGTGALNVAATRVGVVTGRTVDSNERWPANVLIGHSIECRSEGVTHTDTLCVEGCPARILNEVADRPARFFYCAKPRERERVAGTMRNLHPTVKPVEIMRWLIRLSTPPGGTVLDPFTGSGTTGCAAMAEGVSFVGFERDEDSFETSLARVSDWAFAHGRDRPLRRVVADTPK